MSKCKFCEKCILSECPKTKGSSKMENKRISLSGTTGAILDKLCKEKNFLKGASYYQVSDYEKLMKYFIEKDEKE